MSGFAHLVGEPDGPPSLPPFMLADGVAALSAAGAVLAALYHRDACEGAGQHIDVNLIEPLARLIESATLAYDQLGIVPTRTRQPIRRQRTAQLLSDQRRQLARHVQRVTPDGAAGIRPSIGRPDLAADPAYYSPAGRTAHGDEIDKIVADWVAERMLSEALEIFEASDCAVARVYDAEALMADRHLVARGTFPAIADAELGRYTSRRRLPACRRHQPGLSTSGPRWVLTTRLSMAVCSASTRPSRPRCAPTGLYEEKR